MCKIDGNGFWCNTFDYFAFDMRVLIHLQMLILRKLRELLPPGLAPIHLDVNPQIKAWNHHPKFLTPPWKNFPNFADFLFGRLPLYPAYKLQENRAK